MRRACCIGRRVDVWTPRRGVVHSAYASAVNLRFGEAWWTLLAADLSDQLLRASASHRTLPACRDCCRAIRSMSVPAICAPGTT